MRANTRGSSRASSVFIVTRITWVSAPAWTHM